VALNRRLPWELAALDWEVTVMAPRRFHGGSGDLVSTTLAAEADQPFELVPLPAYATRSPHLMFYGPELWRALRRQRFDLIHVWEEPYLTAGAQIAALAPRGTPLVYLTYQNIAKRYPPPFMTSERYVLRRASGWIAGGETVLRALGDRDGYRDRPCRIITLGVDCSAFRPDASARAEVRRLLGWEEDGAPVVGYLGRFVPEKGIEVITRTLERISDPWRALFVGGGPLAGHLTEFADKHAGRVRVVPSVGHDDVPRYVNAMDVLCAPSQTIPKWREQFGRMLVEAMASGVPVVASDSGEIPYVMGDAGMVVPERDDDAWVDALARVLRDPRLRAELSSSGQMRARHFSWASVARRHDAFFREILTGSPPLRV
jgi:glycosyltransferase involved in cell wall biosynthesis